MKKTTILIILFCSLIACKKEPVIKSQTTTTYSVIKDNDSFRKDSIKAKSSVGFYENGSQRYFVGLVGYGDVDTTFYPKSNVREEIKESIKYSYMNGTLWLIEEQKGDTTFYYDPNYPSEFDAYSILNKSKNICIQYERLLNCRSTYLDVKYNQYDHIVSALIKKENLPSDAEKMTDIEYGVHLDKNTTYEIMETEYDYY